MKTVLLSSAGRRVALAECFRRAAQELRLELRLAATDARPELSAACQVADRSWAVPRCTAPEFVPALREICERERVDLLVPTIDTELAVLAESRETFAAIGTRVAVSAPEVVGVARNKLRTSQVFAAAGIAVPRTEPLAGLLAAPETWTWPVVLKPADGSSSVGLKVVRSADEAKRLELPGQAYVAQEQWAGREYTVNLFFDQHGALRCAVPHWRIETRGGEVSKGRTERVPVLMDAATRIAGVLPGARGALCYQAIVRNDGRHAVFELNARFGGGYPLAHQAGARFAQWLLEESAGLTPTAGNDWREGVTMLRYDDAVFIDG